MNIPTFGAAQVRVDRDQLRRIAAIMQPEPDYSARLVDRMMIDKKQAPRHYLRMNGLFQAVDAFLNKPTVGRQLEAMSDATWIQVRGALSRRPHPLDGLVDWIHPILLANVRVEAQERILVQRLGESAGGFMRRVMRSADKWDQQYGDPVPVNSQKGNYTFK